MSKQLKSILLSSAFFVVYVALQLAIPHDSDLSMMWLLADFVIPIGSFFVFWALRFLMKIKGYWHFVRTVWIDLLMVGLCIWGISYFILSGGTSIPTVDPDCIWFQFSFSGALTSIIFLLFEPLVAFCGKALSSALKPQANQTND